MTTEAPETMPGAAWWWWVAGINIALLAVVYWIGFNAAYFDVSIAHEFSLLQENNVAAWWSGFCLIVAGMLFFRLGSDNTLRLADRAMWIVLALVVLALSLDEVGSLHERVALAGGWWALLPFGVLLAGGFVFAITRCLRTGRHRASGLLFIVSLSLFAGVAAMEHLINSRQLLDVVPGYIQLLVEEGMEQLAEFLLILAGVLATARARRMTLRRVTVVVDPQGLWGIREWLYVALALHLSVAILWMPHLVDARLGNPVLWFPMFVFVLNAFHCMHRYADGGRIAWLAGVPLFLLLSIGQVQSFARLLTDAIPPLDGAPLDSFFAAASWTVLPCSLFLALHVAPRVLLVHVCLTVGVVMLLRNGGSHDETYYILSGVYALLCFHVLVSPAIDARRAPRRGKADATTERTA